MEGIGHLASLDWSQVCWPPLALFHVEATPHLGPVRSPCSGEQVVQTLGAQRQDQNVQE